MWQSQYTSDYLAHHGILGMKWGVRRYQNEDGSLTPAGAKRYGSTGSYRSEKDLKRAQEEYDRNVEKNWYKAYNKAADRANRELDRIGDKWEKIFGTEDFNKVPESEYAKYEKECMQLLDDLFAEELDKMFGKRPE